MSTGAQYPGGDTIVAIATPHGRSGLGVVRLSGPHALAIAGALFRPRNAQPVHAMPSFTARLGDIVDGDRTVDEALLLVMRAPRSYTREDVAEFSCHGSPVTLRRIEDLCVARGARRAGPGEFTRRAYVNGRMDLAQAEAVSALICAESALQAEIAAQSMSGSARAVLHDIRARLADVAASLAVLLDHPDELDAAAVDTARIGEQLRTCRDTLQRIIAAAGRARPFLDGASIVLCGKPNAGKSSLFNVLVDRDRSIVSDIPGTTRDAVTERIIIGDIPLTLTDTAGLRVQPDDPLEMLGMERACRAARDSDVVVLLLDAAAGVGPDDVSAAERLRPADPRRRSRAIIAINKIDASHDLPAVRREAAALAARLAAWYDVVPEVPELSCTTLHGIAGLEQTIVAACTGDNSTLSSDERAAAAAVVTRRQADLLHTAAAHLAAAAGAGAGRPELAAEHLAAARRDLAAVTGEDAPPDTVEEVFSRFCVGK
jgi:tRNA modification GTPase